MHKAQVALVVDLGTRLERLERLDHLDGQPVSLVLNLTDNHLVEALQTSLFEDGQHSIVADFELVAKRFCKLQLRLLLLIQALVVLEERIRLLLAL